MSNKSNMITPFGLLFEEAASPPATQMHPYYDEETDLSYVMDETATPVPFVEYNGMLGTQTETKIRSESTDTAPGEEHSQIAVSAGTHTMTAVQMEETDVDHMDSVSRFESHKRVSMGTDTFTETKVETTDTD